MSKIRGTRRMVVVMAAVAVVAASLMVAATAGADTTKDDAIEKRAVLKTSDFPAGWEKTARPDPVDSGIDVCAGIDAVNAALVPLATRSPGFVRPDTENVLASNSVVVLRSAKQAKGYLSPYRSPDAVACLQAVTEKSLAEADFSAVRVNVTPSNEVPSGADDAVGFDLQITVTSAPTPTGPAQTAVIYQDVLFVRVGRALSNFGFVSPGRSLPDQDELVDAVVGRLEDSL